MTLTYGELAIGHGAVNWSYDGSELNTGPYAPTVFLDAEGPLASLTGQGSLAAYAATNVAPLLAATGTLRTSLSAPTGMLVALGASGRLLTYTATGVMEHGTGG